MDWLDRYAQDAAQSAAGGQAVQGAAEDGTSGSTVVRYQGEDDGTGQKKFDGGIILNKAVYDLVLRPVDDIPKETLDYMENARSTVVGKVVTDLAAESRLLSFRKVVKSYIEDGIADAVAAGSQEGLSAFQNWYGDVMTYTGNRDVFGLSTRIPTDIIPLGAI